MNPTCRCSPHIQNRVSIFFITNFYKMSAPLLSLSEQKAAVSGKKKIKKTMKNVLGIPSHLKVESHVIELAETEKLSKILERLLPSARLPVQQNFKCNKDSKGDAELELQQVKEAKSKRNQLSLGVNDLSRSIKKALISAVLMAADIQPRFLVHHLNLLCSHNNIPFLHMSGLREITKNTLGFPCIAVGFKKNFSDFSDAVEEIQLISQNKKIVTTENSPEAEMDSSSEESEKETSVNPVKSEEPPFSYLLRTSIKERIFVPEKCYQDLSAQESDFVKLPKDENETDFKDSKQQLGISSNLIRKHNKKVNSLEEFKRFKLENEGDDDDDDEDLEIPKKKVKKDWVIDKVGNSCRYYPANLRRVPSNPNRNKRK